MSGQGGAPVITAKMLQEAFEAQDGVDRRCIDATNLRNALFEGRFDIVDVASRLSEATKAEKEKAKNVPVEWVEIGEPMPIPVAPHVFGTYDKDLFRAKVEELEAWLRAGKLSKVTPLPHQAGEVPYYRVEYEVTTLPQTQA